MLIMLGAVLAVPFRPAQVVALGAVPVALYMWLQRGMKSSFHAHGHSHRDPPQCCATAAAHATASTGSLRIAEALSGAQLRAQLARTPRPSVSWRQP
jgi:hypothetical protein